MQSKVIIHERELTLFMNYEYDEQYVEQELSKESDWYVEHKGMYHHSGSLSIRCCLRTVSNLYITYAYASKTSIWLILFVLYLI